MFPSLDVLAILAWGMLLLRYWITGEIRLLIHPNYIGLVIAAGVTLLWVGSLRVWQLWHQQRRTPEDFSQASLPHLTLFAPGWSTGLLLGTAILAFLIAPGVLSSQIALQRGVRESLPLTQVEPESFGATSRPEERSLVDWVRTLNAYPEPDAYTGQKVNVQGFVIHKSALSEQYLLLARFVITCCAVDAYPVALPVKLDTSRQAYPPDTWLEVEGEMVTETLPNLDTQLATPSMRRQLVIAAHRIQKIAVPADPYGY